MRLTLLVVASKTGLGYQTKAYYKWLKPHKTVIIDISSLNGQQQNYDWYPDAQIIKGIPKDDQLEDILSDTDVLMTAETPYNMNLWSVARRMKVKTICVENPEFYDHIKYPQYELPDIMILPSVWMEQDIRRHANAKGTKVVQIHHPVDRSEIPFRERTTNKVMHIAGKPATHDRNGTWDFLQAYPEGIVTTQDETFANIVRGRYRQSRIVSNIGDPQYLYQLGDILVMPRKYGGNCLPLNEALASGMPVIMPDISPNNHLLPPEWLVPAYVSDSFTPRTRVEIYSCHPQDMRERIEWMKAQNMRDLSQQASDIADSISWETLLPKYREVIDNA